MRILVFLHGTAIMHRGGVGRSREERVKQVIDGKDESLRDFASYVPVGDAVRKLHRWVEQGAQISYLSSHQRPERVEQDRTVLRKHGFPDGPVLFRGLGEHYADVVERTLPDVLVEDDCESIGGEKEMVSPRVRPELRAGRTWIVVKEFGGIDHLPDDVRELASSAGR